MESLSVTSDKQSWLAWFYRGVLLLVFLFLFARLAELQVIKGDYYRNLAEGNRIRRVPIIAPRGEILARGGEVLVGNRKIKRRVVFDEKEGYIKTEDIKDAPEEEIITEWIRDYPLKDAFGHVGGYLGEVSPDEVGKINPDCPEEGPRRLGELVGRTGLENQYDCLLSGTNGEELVEVDSSGQRIRTLGRRDPVPGQDLRTTIDINLQKKAAEEMGGEIGGVVVTSPDGEVLALYSSPSFDPNIFLGRTDEQEIQRLLQDEDKPFFNRVVGGVFPPGSVFKPVVAIGALEEGEIDEDFTYEDTGQITVDTLYGTFSYSNWYFTQYGGTEGEIGLERAMARSTDTFFYKIGEFLGPDKIAEWAEKFNMGAKKGIDLPGEVAGLIPTPEWKETVRGEQWFLGNTYHISIGQGDLSVTPLSVNTSISAIANDGKICNPRISDEITCKDLNLNDEYVDIVIEGMRQACSSGGTGYTLFGFQPQVACKTGTAETGINDETHAWFTAFAPIENPEIVATVLVEEGGEGSRVAGPIATEIFKYWFGVSEYTQEIPEYAEFE